ncbi:hypothetical protein HOP61_13535 [Halomonas daqingensis]|uniref:Flp family type IVb pilin n=1 Tax=Billgrantia desiderata TaxID=52021 RepID=A0AAW4YUE8_9GAMM|nr:MULTISPECIES: hypothetical protein [Halomonas]MCE8037015.1 hypothetical protein [Halomonas sp. MCCC 1A11062]MCE8043196.1 hypothetical protein [Halomonas desiderata]MCE8047707.1 hypothetical protein [Halomonas desiderata]MCE8052327.1 hypothetical protein [Halomonas desiderata]
MSKLMQGVVRFWREEEGTEVVEWALVAGMIVAIGAAVFTALGTQARVLLNQLLQAIGGTAV